jgi:hypothetical protein
MPWSAADLGRRLAVWLLVVAAAVAFSNATAVSAAPTSPRQLVVASQSQWTNTGVEVHAGDTLVVSATGIVEFRGRQNRVGPEGVPWGGPCRTRESRATVNAPWPVTGAACWSLIGRIGGGRPFEVGRSAKLRADDSGQLQLGINDNYIVDNAGSWNVTVAVTSGAASSNPGATAKHNSSAFLFLILGLVAIAVIVGLVVFARRSRRARSRREASITPAVVARAAPVDNSAIPLVPTDDETTVVPGAYDATKVNIFKVELTMEALRVGYNQFPEGVAVEWTVRDRLVTLAQGSFVTNGGGETEHYVSFPLDLPPTVDGQTMTINFRWSIEEVPFTYSVQRAARARPTPVE